MRPLILTILCAILLAGCGKTDVQRDAADEQNPRVRKGLEQMHLKNWDGAIDQFEKALEKDPKLARPDLELALIYHQYKDDYVSAIYHYKRYLKKRPDTEKRPLIIDWIRQAKISLAGEIGRSSGDISDELIRLKRENNLLRQQLEAFQGKTAPAPAVANVKTILTEPPPVKAAPAAATPAAEPKKVTTPAKPVEPSAPAVPRTYKVVPGDTLFRIARNVYGDGSQWKKIYEANRDTMQNENDLKAGQIITIPVL
ncbi:MAG: hypothetical protein PWQ29_65 [Verrucomicrobiota bacterium]|jgi:LysM repeat protein|nr:hypothetical protein [Verrucomicrobiota bacterium]MDK2962671.1 hypothetical protein [Verrucomicrobiota bacterium]